MSEKTLVASVFDTNERDASRLALKKKRITVGSLESADLCITGEKISPLHALLEVGEQVTIYDLASESGVYVNGKKVVSAKLEPDDVVQIGTKKFTIGFRKFKPPTMEDPVQPPGHTEVFKESASTAACLEIVCSWRGMVLDVRHMVLERELVIGPRLGLDFAIPLPFAGVERYTLVRRVGDQFAVNLRPEMKGMIRTATETLSLSNLGRTEERVLGRDDIAKIDLGDLEFLLSYSAHPPRIGRRRSAPDPAFARTFAISLAATLAFVMGLWQLDVPESPDIETIPDRIATILYQPEKFDRFEQPRDLPVTKPDVTPPTELKTPKRIDIVPGQKPTKRGATVARPKAQASGKEGAGARAKGNEGTRGTPRATQAAVPQVTARRPSPERGKGAGGARSQVAEDGSLDVLRGASERIKDLLGGASARLGKSGERLKGFGAFDTEGTGGLAVSNSGRGGGGKSQGLGGLAPSGSGGGRVGVGAGSSGTGSGILSGRGRVDLRQGGPEETVVMGSIDASAIEAAILAHKDEFRLCYERELNAERPSLSGRVLPLFVIGSTGRVTRAAIKESSLKNANVERCVIQVLKRIEFPAPAGGGTVEVTYPFKFRALGK